MPSPIRALWVGPSLPAGVTAPAGIDASMDAVAVESVEAIADARDRWADPTERFDCVICGPSSRDGDEFAVLEAVRAAWPRLPVVFVVAADDGAVGARAIERGAFDCVRWTGDESTPLLARRIQHAVERAPLTGTRLSPAEFEAVFENVPCGVMLVTVDGDACRYERCNERMAELSGLPVEQIEGHTPSEAFGPEDGAQIEEQYLECVRHSEPIEYTIAPELEGVQVYREGSVRQIASDGEQATLLVIVQDFSEQHQREAELKESKQRLEALFERSPDMINVHDAAGRIVECNPRLSEKTGYDESTLTEMSVWDVDRMADPERALDQWANMGLGDRFRTEGEFRRRDGSTFPVEVHVRRLREDRFLAISRDITDQKERERELREKNERLEEFASVVSHDLRNPLQVLRGALDGVESEAEGAHFDRGHRAIDRMEDMISDILVLARQGDDIEQYEYVSIPAVVGDCWRNVETASATLVVDTDDRIEANETRLKQLLENLLRNAVEHGHPEVEIRVGPLDDGFFVADDGPGIPKPERADVFESGYSNAPNGTGFGLAIVAEIADAHGWAIGLTESESGGARFEFTGVTIE